MDQVTAVALEKCEEENGNIGNCNWIEKILWRERAEDCFEEGWKGIKKDFWVWPFKGENRVKDALLNMGYTCQNEHKINWLVNVSEMGIKYAKWIWIDERNTPKMEEIVKFLKEAETYYLATVEGDRPQGQTLWVVYWC